MRQAPRRTTIKRTRSPVKRDEYVNSATRSRGKNYEKNSKYNHTGHGAVVWNRSLCRRPDKTSDEAAADSAGQVSNAAASRNVHSFNRLNAEKETPNIKEKRRIHRNDQEEGLKHTHLITSRVEEEKPHGRFQLPCGCFNYRRHQGSYNE
ncbi:MAG: hypothetical protein KF868_21685 [Acidobacteria bacterium]|nr:hypothetical protein [Acidobacteriota bacterium]MCW5969514.1 hypothetical protein [Blastocatellales bacterium]